jgi:organic hydroperoxide reductase OsmC/OhrA
MSEVAIRPETKPKVIYRSEIRVTPAGGGIKLVSLPHETEPVAMGMHGAIAAHYKLPEGSYTPRAATLDYLVGATAACLLGTLARALRVREINSDADHLHMDAVGEHEVEDGVVILRRIHLTAHLRAMSSQHETAERVFPIFASKCPVHRSIEKAIDITTELDFQPTDAA